MAKIFRPKKYEICIMLLVKLCDIMYDFNTNKKNCLISQS